MRRKDPAKVQEQREHIMRAALKCFARKGVQDTTTDDICRAAKVSSGTLYYYFKSRDGLLHDLIIHAHATRDQLLADLKDVPNLMEAAIAAQYASRKAIEAQGMPLEVFLELLVYAQRNKASKAAFQEAAARIMTILTDAVDAHQRAGKLPSDIPADALARFLSVVAAGTSVLELVDPDFAPDAYREAISAMLYRNVDAPAKAQAASA